MSGDCGSVSGVLVYWSLDLGSTPEGSLSFSFPLDLLGLCMLTSTCNLIQKIVHCTYIVVVNTRCVFKNQLSHQSTVSYSHNNSLGCYA